MNHYGYQNDNDYRIYASMATSVAPVPPPPPRPQMMFKRNPVVDNGNVAYGNWMRAGVQPDNANIERTFPHKIFFSQNSARGKRKWSKMPNRTSNKAEPQTPAALLNQHFKNIDEKYKEVAKSCFQCILLVNGQEFSMEAATKKHAKQRTAELALRSLRPELEFASFENGVEIKPFVTSLDVPNPTPTPVPITLEPSTKRVKSDALSAADSAVSIGDFLRRICIERNAEGPFNAKFTFMEVSTEGVSTLDMPNKLYKCSLSFPEQGLFFVKEHATKPGAKDLACIQALTDLFKVTSEQLRNIARRSVLCKSLNKQQGASSSVNTLHQVALTSMCDLKFDVSVATVVGKDKGMGTGSTKYQCLLTVTDHTKNDQEVTFTSPPMKSKQAAKEYAAIEILRSYFFIDPADAGSEKNADLSPISQLYNLLVRYKRNESPIFQELANDPTNKNLDLRFMCKVTVGEREYVASGSSKKAAKQAVAAVALKNMFSCHTSPIASADDIRNENDDSIERSTSSLCLEVVTFTKDAYFKMCAHLNLKKGTSVAGICLLNEKDEKRVVSLATTPPHVVRLSGVVTSQGTSIVHMDPIVLARRSFNRYLLSEIEKSKSDPTACIVMRAEDGKWKIKPTIRVLIFSSRPPSLICNLAHSRKLLTTVAFDDTIEAVPDHVLGAQEIHNDDYLRVHTAADKIFKWTQLGMQGGLLSNIMHPVIPHGVMFASQSSHSQEDLRLALTDRLGTNQSEILVDYIDQPLREIPSEPLVYTKDLGHEQLGLQTGRTIAGAPSRYSKAALFESFKKLKDLPRETSYAEAKKLAVDYSTKKKELYDKLNEAGFGHWQQKPSTLLDFSAVVFD